MLECQHLTKTFQGVTLLDNVNWQWPATGRFATSAVGGERPGVQVVALLGASGAGKTSLLRLIAGLDHASAGCVRWDGQDLSKVPPERRGFALMFQDFALFPHLNVQDNVAFGLREQGQSRAAARATASQALARMGLGDFTQRAVTALSGGEQQRVALARALVTQPRLFLLDEPFSSLDTDLRTQLRSGFLNDLQANWDGKASGISRVLLVTHDEAEAREMASHAWRLSAGALVSLW